MYDFSKDKDIQGYRAKDIFNCSFLTKRLSLLLGQHDKKENYKLCQGKY